MQSLAPAVRWPGTTPKSLPPWPLQIGAALLLGAVLWAFYGGGYVSLGAMWSLAWGRDLIGGSALSFSGTSTPHVLSNLIGAGLTPLGKNADHGLIALEFFAAGGLVWLTGCLAREIGGLGAGFAAAVLMGAREQLLYATTSAFLDVFVALFVVWAALLVVRNPERGNWPAACLLLLAGLLRPEPWLLAGALWAWRVWRGRSPGGSGLGLSVVSGGAGLRWRQLALVLAAPALWLLSDRVLSGDALFSVHETKRVNALLRKAGDIPDTFKEHVVAIPRNVAHAAGPDVLVVALLVALVVLWPRAGRAPLLRLIRPADAQRPQLLVALAAAAILSLGLAIEALGGALLFARFALPLAALLIVVVAVGLAALARSVAAAWKGEAGASSRRTDWLLAGFVLVFCLVQVPLLADARKITGAEHDRYSAMRAAITPGIPCGPVTTPNLNIRANVSVWTGVRAPNVLQSPEGIFVLGSLVTADGADAQLLLRDKTFPQAPAFRVEAGAPAPTLVRRSGGWVIEASCIPGSLDLLTGKRITSTTPVPTK
jgi:hypothetical protein